MRPLAYLLYALALLSSYFSLLGLDGLIPGGIVLGFWAFVFTSTYRPRALGNLLALAIAGLLIISLLMPSVQQARESARRSTCKNNLKQIGIALHNYHEVHGSFPPAYIADENGKPLLSWRVLLLPYVDAEALFREFDLTKPWDSPENRELQKHTPSVFACPSQHPSRAGSTYTSYVAVVGPRMAWPGSNSIKIPDMKDGESNIIMLVEHHSDIAWTEPRDLSLDDTLDVMASTDADPFAGHRGESFFAEYFYGRHVLMVEGSVRFAPFGLDRTLTRELLTIDDEQPAKDWDMADAGAEPVTRIRWGNVIRLVMVVCLTLLPLPWVWIHPQGSKTLAYSGSPGERGA